MTHAFKPQAALTLAALTLAALTLAALTLAVFAAAPAAFAAPAPAMHAKKMAAAKTVYVCNDCKAYYTPAMAKKMGYKDGMGHTLVKSAKVPAGYMDGSKMKM